MGAVVHTLNLRRFPELLAYVMNHGEDRIVFVDASLLPVFESVAMRLRTVERFIVIGEAANLPEGFLRYEELVAREQPYYQWPQLDERSAASVGYTTGPTST